MGKSKAASLDSSVLMPAKGQAQPVTAKTPTGELISMTLRLDAARYERLKMYGLKRRKSSQEVLLQALDRFLDAEA